MTPATYQAVAMQLTARSVAHLGTDDARAAILSHIAAIGPQIAAARIFIEQFVGVPVGLVVLPEYLFTSYPGRLGIPDFAAHCAFAPDGREYAALGSVAQGIGLHLAVNAYETDAHFPGLYFQASTVVAPSGDVVLRYRRLNSMYAPTPHDVWSRYLDIYGVDGVFPVARTDVGNLAAIASEEILYPEIARAHALRGAEVFVHSSSEIGAAQPTNKQIARRARAFENLAYVVSANTAGISGTVMPVASADGRSAVIDWQGRVLAEAGPGETFTAFGEIDLAAQRAGRRRPGMTNLLARQRLELFASSYAGTIQAADTMLDAVPERDHFRRAHAATIERLDKAGLI